MVRIPQSTPHGTQVLLPSKFCLLAPEKRARIVSHSGERGVRIAEVEGSIPLPSTKTGNRRGFYHGDFSFDHRNTTDGF